jgi:predicted amidohydrolase YtcJ
MKGQSADLIVHNAVIHSMDENMTTYEAMAIKDGKIIELGPERQILNKYASDNIVDAQKKNIYPGLTDGHGHILGLADMMLSVTLFGCTSMDELIETTKKYQEKKNRVFILGRGWDQSLWGQDALPTNDQLNIHFPNTPVCLYRVDGHALLANDAALKMAGITASSQFDGGRVALKNGQPTGLLVDNAMEVMADIIPAYTDEEMLEKMNLIQDELLGYGITGVHEAGIPNKQLHLFEKWVESDLKIDLYGMLMPDEANLDLIKKKGKFSFGSVTINSIKMYADGALGSRGALLKKEYSDEHDHFGLLATPLDEMKNLAQFCLEYDYQLNAHAIGDSANKILLDIFQVAHAEKPDHRWRIEHAQIVDPADFSMFSQNGILPSVQPTHAVSDQRWAEKRLGKERLTGAYAYQTLLKETGILILGTDFPVEQTNPFLTIHAATARKDQKNFPNNGFLANESISIEDCLKGMTIWPAIGSFQEKTKGSLEVGKEATFVMLNKGIKASDTFVENHSLWTVIRGESVLDQR